MRNGVLMIVAAVAFSFATPAGATGGTCDAPDSPLGALSDAVEGARRHGRGVRTDYPETVVPESDVAPAPASASAMKAAYDAAVAKNKLENVSAAKAKALEKSFNKASAVTENLSGGRVGASIQGMVVDGELFVRTKTVRPGTTPKWQSAGPMKKAPKPAALEARVKKVVAERMGLMSNPDFALKASELAEVKKGIADGEFKVVNATPTGLLGVGYTGYVTGNMLIVEKRAVRPGAKSTFFLLGPID